MTPTLFGNTGSRSLTASTLTAGSRRTVLHTTFTSRRETVPAARLMTWRLPTATRAGNIGLNATEGGAVLDLPNLTEVTAADWYRLEVQAYGAGQVKFPALNKVNGALSFYADDSGSHIDASGLSGLVQNSGSSNSRIGGR